jgi:hypothetical protein
MAVVDRIGKLEVGVGSVAFWGLGQVGVAINFVSYLHGLNPSRRHKVQRPGELIYFVGEIS